MAAQVLFFDVFFEKDLHLNAAEDARIHKKILGSGTTTPIIFNGEMEDIMKTVKSLQDSGYY